MEKRRGVRTILEHIGPARGEAELAALMAVTRGRLISSQDIVDLGLADPADTGTALVANSAILWQVLACAYDWLGFDAVTDEVFCQLVLARIIEPTSKLNWIRVLDEIGAPGHRCPRSGDTGPGRSGGTTAASSPGLPALNNNPATRLTDPDPALPHSEIEGQEWE